MPYRSFPFRLPPVYTPHSPSAGGFARVVPVGWAYALARNASALLDSTLRLMSGSLEIVNNVALDIRRAYLALEALMPRVDAINLACFSRCQNGCQRHLVTILHCWPSIGHHSPDVKNRDPRNRSQVLFSPGDKNVDRIPLARFCPKNDDVRKHSIAIVAPSRKLNSLT